jgi:hypothetical protein
MVASMRAGYRLLENGEAEKVTNLSLFHTLCFILSPCSLVVDYLFTNNSVGNE